MHDLLLVLVIVAGLAVTLFYPYCGILLWTWFSIQAPHEETFSFARTLPLNLIIAAITILAWPFSRERKMPPASFLVITMLLFLAWATLNTCFAFDGAQSWPYWDRTWKTFALGIFVAILADNRVRIHALVWVITASLLYYGVKGGIFTLIHAGAYRVYGPPDTIIADNNQIALALLMALPLASYLRRQSRNSYVSWGLVAAMALTLLAVVGSYSRGAFLGLAALGAVTALRSRNRFAFLGIVAIVGIAFFELMPTAFWDRMLTITSANSDASFQGRELAWSVAWRYATDHFPFGAGFYGPQLPAVFHMYFPQVLPHAAHSIYFEVLGDNGFVGLAIYLLILGGAFVKCSTIIRASRGVPDQEWLHDLAKMIQLSIFAFCVAGAALSMAYYEGFIVCIGVLVSLGRISASSQPRNRSTTVPAARGAIRNDVPAGAITPT